ncbi:hypothetical protein ASwh1_404 [Aeromonas phage Aswh_1]|nr:hypothetical protein ASwh1_404 [Aeromonas phage Aswh_1]
MKTKDQAIEDAFNELMNMPDEYFKQRLKESIENPGVFGRMVEDGFIPCSVIEVIENENH